MDHGKRKVGLPGICILAVLGVTLMGATGAEAAEWKESGKKIEISLFLIGEADSSEWTLDSEVAGVTVKITCNSLALSEGTLSFFGTALAKLSFSNCSTFVLGSLSKPCAPVEPISTTVSALQFLHSSRDYLYVSPDNGSETFTTIKFTKNGSECAVAENLNVKGSAVVEDGENKARTEQPTHLIQHAASLLLFTGFHQNSLKLGSQSARLLGSERIKLLTGNNWSANAL